MNGVFATHLHEITTLPLNTKHVQDKKMRSTLNPETGDVIWDYVLEDGSCSDSMALATAKEYHIDQEIIDRALELQKSFDRHCRGGQTANSNEHEDNSTPNFREREEQFYASCLRDTNPWHRSEPAICI